MGAGHDMTAAPAKLHGDDVGISRGQRSLHRGSKLQDRRSVHREQQQLSRQLYIRRGQAPSGGDRVGVDARNDFAHCGVLRIRERKGGRRGGRSCGYLRWGRKRGCDFFQGLRGYGKIFTWTARPRTRAAARQIDECRRASIGSGVVRIRGQSADTCRESGQCTSNSKSKSAEKDAYVRLCQYGRIQRRDGLRSLWWDIGTVWMKSRCRRQQVVWSGTNRGFVDI